MSHGTKFAPGSFPWTIPPMLCRVISSLGVEQRKTLSACLLVNEKKIFVASFSSSGHGTKKVIRCIYIYIYIYIPIRDEQHRAPYLRRLGKGFANIGIWYNIPFRDS